MNIKYIELFRKDLQDQEDNVRNIMRDIAEKCNFSSRELLSKKDLFINDYGIEPAKMEWIIFRLYFYEYQEKMEEISKDRTLALFTDIAKEYDFSPERINKNRKEIEEKWNLNRLEIDSLISNLRKWAEHYRTKFLNESYKNLEQDIIQIKAMWWRINISKY